MTIELPDDQDKEVNRRPPSLEEVDKIMEEKRRLREEYERAKRQGDGGDDDSIKGPPVKKI
jgi:hypothetical protein